MAQTSIPISKRKKLNVKEALPVPERVRRHFKSLVAQIDGGHLKNAIKTCDKILRLEPSDPDALKTKLALLLHTEQYAPALALAESLSRDSGPTMFALEFGRAYALYRLNRESAARDVVRGIQPVGDYEERGVLHMEAQIEYRRGNYQRAQDLYSQIFDSLPPSDEQSDCLTNLSASQTHLEFLQAGFLRALHVLPSSRTNALEDAPPPVIPVLHPVLSAVPTSQQPSSAPQKRTPRVSRIPKDVVPGVTPPPDPERWLKKNERTNMPRSGKRRKGVATGATQGSLYEGGSKGGGGKGKKRK